MDAGPVLREVAAALRECALEAILIGNAAAALHGAPVTTIDVDFFFRKTPGNLRKLKMLASRLRAVCFKPVYPISGLVRISRDEDTLQLDFMPAIHGVRSFNSLRSRASRLDLGSGYLLVASLSDIIKSKRAAGRPRDHAVLDVLEKVLAAPTKESDRQLVELIDRLLARPMLERTHFLRKRVGIASTCL